MFDRKKCKNIAIHRRFNRPFKIKLPTISATPIDSTLVSPSPIRKSTRKRKGQKIFDPSVATKVFNPELPREQPPISHILMVGPAAVTDKTSDDVSDSLSYSSKVSNDSV